VKSLWDGRCTVYVREAVTNPANGQTDQIEVATLKNEPCRLSHGSSAGAVSAASPKSSAAAVNQGVKLIISKDIVIPAGSKITVTQNGKTADYIRSGESAMFSVHNEIALELFERWA
ncbi:MAG: hypothetical protein FWE80_06795, partial [Oscillospiraceae bacterium]|nr:hypothetical protein [Oscillospiraceae bacterium]